MAKAGVVTGRYRLPHWIILALEFASAVSSGRMVLAPAIWSRYRCLDSDSTTSYSPTERAVRASRGRRNGPHWEKWSFVDMDMDGIVGLAREMPEAQSSSVQVVFAVSEHDLVSATTRHAARLRGVSRHDMACSVRPLPGL